jgi:hypothetical protein
MDAKIKEVTQAIINAIESAPEMSAFIDGADREPVSLPDESQTFMMIKHQQNGNNIVYFVTVTAQNMSDEG